MPAQLGWQRPSRMAKELFGTDGIRGIPGKFPLDDATLERVGWSLGNYLAAQTNSPRVLIGRDTRESGPRIAQRIAQGLAAASADPVSAGVLTTPGVAWLVNREGFAAGVVISASHNPYHDNGVKMISSTGMKFPDAVEHEIETRILAHHGPLPPARGLPPNGDTQLHDEYLEGLCRGAFPGASFAGMKIVVDCANGAASALAPQLFCLLGAEVVAMNNNP